MIDSLMNENTVNGKTTLQKKINFWRKYRKYSISIAFSFFVPQLLFGAMTGTISIFVVTTVGFVLNTSISLVLSKIFIQRHKFSLQEITNQELNYIKEIEKMMDNNLDFEAYQVMDQVFQNCTEDVKVENVSKMIQLLVETGPHKVPVYRAICNIGETPLNMGIWDTFCDRIVHLNLQDMRLVRQLLEEYVSENTENLKISRMAQLVVETKFLNVPVEEATYHLPSEEVFVKKKY